MEERIRHLKGLISVLALLGTFYVSAEPSVPTVRKIGVVFAEKDRSLVQDIIRIFARQVSQRTSAEVVLTGDTPFKIELAVRPGIGKEGYFIADVSGRSILIAGNDPRGLLYGVGKFLRTSRFDLGGFTPGTWPVLCRVHGEFLRRSSGRGGEPLPGGSFPVGLEYGCFPFSDLAVREPG